MTSVEARRGFNLTDPPNFAKKLSGERTRRSNLIGKERRRRQSFFNIVDSIKIGVRVKRLLEDVLKQ